MARSTAVATEGLTLRSAATISAGGKPTHNLDLNDDATIGGATSVGLQFDITDSGSAPVDVNLYSSPDSGTTFDNTSLPGGFSTNGNGTQVKQTVTVDARVVPFLQVELVNNDGTNPTGTVAVRYFATKYDTS